MSAADKLLGGSKDVNNSYKKGQAITLSDSTTYTDVRGLWIGGTGNLKVTMLDGGDVTLEAIPAGTHIPVAISKAWSTGSTASATLKVIGLY
jgi:hypothetical protein